MQENPRAVHAEFEFTAKDAMVGALWSFFRNRSVRAIYAILAIVAIAGAIPPLLGRRGGGRPWPYAIAFFLVLPALVAVGAWLRFRNTPVARRKNRYSFSEAGVSIASAVAHADLSWPAVLHAVETRSAFYLGPQPGMWQFVPKRAFKTEPDLSAARRFIANGLGKRARLRGVS